MGRRVLTKASIEGVNTRAGDFAVGELSEAINTPKRKAFVTETYRKYAGTRKGMTF